MLIVAVNFSNFAPSFPIVVLRMCVGLSRHKLRDHKRHRRPAKSAAAMTRSITLTPSFVAVFDKGQFVDLSGLQYGWGDILFANSVALIPIRRSVRDW